ncbi:MAG: hypothetical protein IKX26_02465 [Bacteroidales bacterium]|nr:hypothetical protein [Bacteroidales bacterium]
MNKILILIGIALGIAVISAIILSCSRKAKAQEPLRSVPSPETIAEEENLLEGAGDRITSFRYESFVGESFCNSEVYSLSLSEYGSYLYWRKSGNLNATGMGHFDAGDIYSDFEKAVKDYSLNKYPYTPLDKEDKDKDRWLVQINYKDGHQISIVHYLDNPIAEKDRNFMEAVRGIFQKLFNYIEEKDIQCEHSRYTYNSKGKLSRRIDYTADGIVRGGWDADDPLADF